MARLVDVDEVKAKMESTFDMQDLYLPYHFQNMLDEMPTVDAVPVVRCRDCMYRDGSVCDYSAVYVRPNGYCQWGRREEDETN